MESPESDFTPDPTLPPEMTCDHNFGDDGLSPHCLKCNTGRQKAEQMGRALFKAAVHKRYVATKA